MGILATTLVPIKFYLERSIIISLHLFFCETFRELFALPMMKILTDLDLSTTPMDIMVQIRFCDHCILCPLSCGIQSGFKATKGLVFVYDCKWHDLIMLHTIEGETSSCIHKCRCICMLIDST